MRSTSMSFKLVLVFVVLTTILSSANAFVRQPISNLSFHHQTKPSTSIGRDAHEFIPDHKTPKNILSSSLAAEAAATNGKKGPARNMFHDYDKPIVLVGTSGGGNELHRLAESLLRNQFGVSPGADLEKQIISVITTTKEKEADKDDILVVRSGEDLKRSIDEKTYAWPSIIVVDFGSDTVANAVKDCSDDYKEATSVIQKLKATVQSLYENSHLLSIYVNVDSTKSQMSDVSAAHKQALEDELFVPFSDYEICIKDEGLVDFEESSSQDDEWQHIEWELVRLLARARLIPAIPGDKCSANSAHLTMGDNTFFLSLSFPDISQVEPYISEMCQDVDAMEYRTDLLDCRDSRFDLIYGLQLLRRYCRPHTSRVPALPFGGSVIEDCMPIVYTVRTQNQAGTYPDDKEGIENMFNVLSWGLRAGVEVLDVESAWDESKTCDLLDRAEERYASQILGSHHVVGKEIELEDAVVLFQNCALGGRAHGAKVVLSIQDEEKDRMAYEAALITTELAKSAGDPEIPNISLILGDVGQFSRVINLPFTPVTHESLPFKAAPGQMTANEIMTTRLLTGIFSPKKYAILGHNIAYSVSPQMHGAAFSATKLTNEYVRVDVPTVKEFIESDFFKSDDFGGASVTIPHKQAIIPHVDVMSDAATAIGSVNTVIARQEFREDDFVRVIYGDNTDWKGIFNPLKRLLGSTVDVKTDFALILGAGGTARAAAYVAQQLGLQPIYYNRTPSKAKELAVTFGGSVVSSLEGSASDDLPSLDDVLGKTQGARIRVVISTLPAAAEFTLPESLVALPSTKPIIFDVNYKPYTTALLKQAELLKCSVVRGSEMLWEQGVGQFELWTGRTAPYAVMKQVVLDNCKE